MRVRVLYVNAKIQYNCSCSFIWGWHQAIASLMLSLQMKIRSKDITQVTWWVISQKFFNWTAGELSSTIERLQLHLRYFSFKGIYNKTISSVLFTYYKEESPLYSFAIFFSKHIKKQFTPSKCYFYANFA